MKFLIFLSHCGSVFIEFSFLNIIKSTAQGKNYNKSNHIWNSSKIYFFVTRCKKINQKIKKKKNRKTNAKLLINDLIKLRFKRLFCRARNLTNLKMVSASQIVCYKNDVAADETFVFWWRVIWVSQREDKRPSWKPLKLSFRKTKTPFLDAKTLCLAVSLLTGRQKHEFHGMRISVHVSVSIPRNLQSTWHFRSA